MPDNSKTTQGGWAMSKPGLYPELAKKIQKAVKDNSFQVADTQLRRAIDDHLIKAYCLAVDGHLKNMNGGRGPSDE